MAGLLGNYKQGDQLKTYRQGGGLLDILADTEVGQGLLNLVTNPVDQVKKTVKNTAKKVRENNANIKAAFESGDIDRMAQQAIDSSQTALGFAPIGMTAWHGSPHKFDKFSLDKIGTGEGAQAYGHGLYLAESPDVAKNYAGALSAARANKPIGNVDLQQVYQNLPNDVPDSLLAARRDFRALHESGDLSAADRRDFLEAVKGNITASRGGALYKTDIPDEAVARFLDYDNAIPESLRQPLSKAALDEFGSGISMGSGEQAYKTILDEFRFKGNQNPAAAASEWLAKQGVPGIRYLDGGSRSAGQGSSNFVVFSPDMIRILERNGQATGLQPWKPGEWGGLLDEAPKVKEGPRAETMGLLDSAPMYSVKSNGSLGHEIYDGDTLLGTVKTGKAKDAIATFQKQQEELRSLQAQKKKQTEVRKLENDALKSQKADLERAMQDYGDVISNAHKHPALSFQPLDNSIFDSKFNPLIHQSPAYGKKQGSSYKLIMIDGKPAYARQADHWGEFNTTDWINGEPVSSVRNWPLTGVDSPAWGGERQSGYILLDDLLKMKSP